MFSNEDLKIISNCPVCNSRNFPSQVKILNERDNAHLLHINCRKCHSNVLVLITSGHQGLMSIGLLTDLNSDEVLKFSRGREVSDDDVLELYEMVNDPKQDFFNLIK